jgi:hypothetical protein
MMFMIYNAQKSDPNFGNRIIFDEKDIIHHGFASILDPHYWFDFSLGTTLAVCTAKGFAFSLAVFRSVPVLRAVPLPNPACTG